MQIKIFSGPKYLGDILDFKITGAADTNKRANLAYPALHRLIPLISKNSRLKIEIKLILYKICVIPIITYGHQIWAAAANTHINRIQKIQNKFLRIIFNKLYDSPIKSLHEIADIPFIKQYIHNSLSEEEYN